MNNTVLAREMYSEYVKEHGNDVPYALYRLVIERFFQQVSDAIIQGEAMKMPDNMGWIKIRKYDRVVKLDKHGNITNPAINWAATNKLKKEEGVNKWVLYTDPYYLRWTWVKGRSKCRVKNHTVYSFKPTSDNPHAKNSKGETYRKRGNKGKLVIANQENPMLHLEYQHIKKKSK